MNEYIKPTLIVIEFYSEDIIRTSGETPVDEIGNPVDMGIDWWAK